MKPNQELLRATACAIVDRLRRRDVTPLELLDTLEARIAEVDGQVNALPTLCFDRARKVASQAVQALTASEQETMFGLIAKMSDALKDR